LEFPWGPIVLVVGVALAFSVIGPGPKPQTVTTLDLQRYLGTWYALAHIPTRFERGCAQGTTATYKLLPNGQIEVVNECYDARGRKSRVVGRAWIPNPQEPAKLKVSFVSLFGMWLFAGDYWVVDLAAEYTYAVVGHPARSFGWILSRTPSLPEGTMVAIRAKLEAQGYRWDQFKPIDQSIHLKGP